MLPWDQGVSYLPTPDHGRDLARLDAMVLSLTRAVVSLYGAVVDIASTTENPELRQALNQTTDEVSERLDEVIAAMKRGNATST